MSEEADYAEPGPKGRLPSWKTFTLFTLALLAAVAALAWMGGVLWGFVKAVGHGN